MAKQMKIGTAYAFFNCDAGKKAIRELLPAIREMQKVPPAVETILTTPRKIDANGNLPLKKLLKSHVFYQWKVKFKAADGTVFESETARIWYPAGMQFALKAVYPGATNEAAAGELTAILNQAYQSPLFKDKEEFTGDTFYEKNGIYVSAREGKIGLPVTSKLA
ncbi:Uncharacterised protein [uncultured archaeon]|nr:Uncharacterised protein [uncultured archaeon]